MPANASIKKGLTLIESDPSKILGLTVGKHTVTPGLYIPRADAASAPEITFSAASPSKTYLVINIDPDAPFKSWPVLPALHWLQAGLKATEGSTTLKSEDPFVVNYAPPGPPPGASPHRYIFLLYEQPEGFDAKKFGAPDGGEVGIRPRMRYSLDKFEKEAGLGDAIAVNYFESN